MVYCWVMPGLICGAEFFSFDVFSGLQGCCCAVLLPLPLPLPLLLFKNFLVYTRPKL